MKFWPFGKKKAQSPISVTAAEDAVPTHLKSYFVRWQEKREATQIIGDIRCTCGCMAFAASQSKDDDCVFRLTCNDCGQEILLFDARVHGWDALVCHMSGEFFQLGDVAARCEKCGSERFCATVLIEPTDKAEFVSCVAGELPDSEWVNAFTWFAAHLTCVECGCKMRDWADIETA